MAVDPRLTNPEEVTQWNRWVRKKLAACSGAILVSMVLLVLSFAGVGVPSSSNPGDWFQRSGAAVTVFCVYNQQLLGSISKALLPSAGFANMSKVAVWQKYLTDIPMLERLNFGLMLTATLIWGYGDIVRRVVTSLFAS